MTLRIALVDDAILFREGLARLLDDAGHHVVAQAGDATRLHELVAETEPDIVVVDVRMPPTHTTEGLVAALQLRRTRPDLAIVILSQYVEIHHAIELLEHDPSGVAYLLKQRVTDIDTFLATLERTAAGGSVLDPEVARLLVDRRRRRGPLDRLSERELEVLTLMAEGRSNQGIIDRLTVSQRTVETHIRNIFIKLGLTGEPDDHRRVLAVITYLRSLDSPKP